MKEYITARRKMQTKDAKELNFIIKITLMYNPMAAGLAADWSTPWYIFAAYAFVVGIAFMILFKQPADPNEKVA